MLQSWRESVMFRAYSSENIAGFIVDHIISYEIHCSELIHRVEL